MDNPSDTSDFKRLDKILEQAYALEGEARSSFVEQLPAPQKEQIERLLSLSHELTISKITEEAQSVIENHDRDDGVQEDNIHFLA